MKTKTRLAQVSVLAAAALTLAGCEQITNMFSGGSSGAEDLFSVAVGECFTFPDESTNPDEEVASLAVVDCAEAHEGEVFAETTLPEGDFPGVDAIEQATAAACTEAAFAEYVGISYAESQYGIGTLFPTEDTWTELDDRLVTCYLGVSGGSTGAAAGSAQ